MSFLNWISSVLLRATVVLFLVSGVRPAAAQDTGAWATTSHRLNIVNQAFYLGIEPCDHQDLTVELGRTGLYDADWWEQVAIETSGKRMPVQADITMKFTRPIGVGENCDSDGTRRDLPPCLSIDPIRVDKHLAVTAQVPTINGQKVDCNAKEIGELTDLSQLQIVEHKVPMRVRRFLGIPNQVIAWFEEPLMKDCEYRAYLWIGPMNEEKRCLVEPKDQHFWIIEDERRPFERETINRRYDTTTGALLSFDIRPEVTVSPEEIWKRYDLELGLGRDDKLELVRGPSPSRYDPEIQHSHYRQLYKGYPVDGGRYLLQIKDGWVRSATGRILSGLNLNIDASQIISESAALEAAKGAVGATQYLWEWRPASFQLPKGELMIVSQGMTRQTDSWKLAWRFQISSHTPADSYIIDIDALTGGIVHKFSNYADSADEPETTTPLPTFGEDVPSEGLTYYDGRKTEASGEFIVGRIVQEGETHYVLKNKGPPVVVTYIHRGGDNLDYIVDWDLNNVFDGCQQGNAACDPASPSTWDYPEQVFGVSVHWAINLALRWFRSINPHWLGIDELANLPIYAFVSSGNDLIPQSISGRFAPPGLNFDFSVFLFDLSGTLPDVYPSVVGHELCHGVIFFANPASPYYATNDRMMVEEGLCTVFGTLLEFYIRETSPGGQLLPDWCGNTETNPMDPCRWNLAAPQLSLTMPSPDTYKGKTYLDLAATCPKEDPACKRHQMGMVAAHAYYLMMEGGQGINELECSFEVKPLDPNPVESRKKGVKILFQLMTSGLMSMMLDYPDLRYVTLEAARMLYGLNSHEYKVVQDAFHAVGIGESSYNPLNVYYQPPDGKIDEEPWPTYMAFDPTGFVPQSQWEIQVSYSLDFKEELLTAEVTVGDAAATRPFQTEDGTIKNLLGFAENLFPDATYYWRMRPKSSDPSEPWGQCFPVRRFKTASKAPEILEPSTGRPQLRSPSGPSPTPTVRTADPWGAKVVGESVKGASEYFVKVSENAQDTCRPGGDPKLEGVVAASNQPTFEKSFSLKADTMYYAYAHARGPVPEKLEGDCSNKGEGIAFKTTLPQAPVLKLPAENGSVPYGQDVTFHWSNIPGAKSYTLTVTTKAGGASRTFSVPAASPVDEAYAVPAANASQDFNGYCWTVQAIGPLGDGGDIATPSCYGVGPTTPTIVAPVGGGHEYSGTLVFQWVNQHAPGGYDVNLQGAVQHVGPTATQASLSVALQPETSYTWSVTAVDPVNPANNKTATATFTTKKAPIVCGNGKVEAGEECDGGEGCSSTCQKKIVRPSRLTFRLEEDTLNSWYLVVRAPDGSYAGLDEVIDNSGLYESSTGPYVIEYTNPPSGTYDVCVVFSRVVQYSGATLRLKILWDGQEKAVPFSQSVPFAYNYNVGYSMVCGTYAYGPFTHQIP